MRPHAPRFTEEQRNKITNLAIPLISFLRQEGHPHMKAIVDNESIEIVEGIACGRIRFEEGVEERA